jgi:hypothetical protein
MELRRSPRFELDQPVIATDLDDRVHVPAKLANFSSHGIRLIVETRFKVGALLKVEWNGTLVLGEVIYCRPEQEGFSVGVELEHALYDVENLARQMGAKPVSRKAE